MTFKMEHLLNVRHVSDSNFSKELLMKFKTLVTVTYLYFKGISSLK